MNLNNQQKSSDARIDLNSSEIMKSHEESNPCFQIFYSGIFNMSIFEPVQNVYDVTSLQKNFP